MTFSEKNISHFWTPLSLTRQHTQSPQWPSKFGKESGNPQVLTTAEEQKTHSLFTPLPLKRKIMYVNERVNIKKEPKRSWYDVFVLENTALPHSKRQKLTHEASINLHPIHPKEPNTSTPINISEDELTVIQGGDTGSKQPTITLPNVSTSPELQTLDPERDIPRSDSSGEVRQLSGNSSSDEPERVYHTLHPSQGSEGNVGSPFPDITLPTSPLPEGTFLASILKVSPTKIRGERKLLGKRSSDEPSRIFCAGTSSTQAGMSVSRNTYGTCECYSITSPP